MTDDAEAYRLAQAAKMIRLGLVYRDEDGNIVVAPEEMWAEHRGPDGKITPDPIDYIKRGRG